VGINGELATSFKRELDNIKERSFVIHIKKRDHAVPSPAGQFGFLYRNIQYFVSTFLIRNNGGFFPPEIKNSEIPVHFPREGKPLVKMEISYPP